MAIIDDIRDENDKLRAQVKLLVMERDKVLKEVGQAGLDRITELVKALDAKTKKLAEVKEDYEDKLVDLRAELFGKTVELDRLKTRVDVLGKIALEYKQYLELRCGLDGPASLPAYRSVVAALAPVLVIEEEVVCAHCFHPESSHLEEGEPIGARDCTAEMNSGEPCECPGFKPKDT